MDTKIVADTMETIVEDEESNEAATSNGIVQEGKPEAVIM